ncbi:unnamed protein product [Prorocentrum cordatum]|uniref:PepSY domain-containing protein n=1 Tax=Prorocentrum cordatum TaxID=2364126 RepID=A0ABN9PNN4_9DINO|nr:unnamed protein product [Polarella glacialis]
MSATSRCLATLIAVTLVQGGAGDSAPGPSEACRRDAASEELEEAPLLQVKAAAESNRSSQTSEGPSCCSHGYNSFHQVFCDPFCVFYSQVGCMADGQNAACRYCGVSGSQDCRVRSFGESDIDNVLGEVRRTWPGARISGAEWEPDEGHLGTAQYGGSFEVDVTTPDGSVWEVDVSPTGKILEIEGKGQLLQAKAAAESNRSSQTSEGPSCCSHGYNSFHQVFCDPFCVFYSQVGCMADGQNAACRYCGVSGSQDCSVRSFGESDIDNVLGEVRRTWPGARISGAEWEPDEGHLGTAQYGGSFEVDVTTPDGSVWEVDVSPTGKILEIEGKEQLLQAKAAAESNRSNQTSEGPSCCSHGYNSFHQVFCDPFCVFYSQVGCMADGQNAACRYCGVSGSQDCRVRSFGESDIDNVLGEVRRTWPGARISGAEWEPDEGHLGTAQYGGSFEVDVTTPDGSVWEVDVSPTGKILEIEGKGQLLQAKAAAESNRSNQTSEGPSCCSHGYGSFNQVFCDPFCMFYFQVGCMADGQNAACRYCGVQWSWDCRVRSFGESDIDSILGEVRRTWPGARISGAEWEPDEGHLGTAQYGGSFEVDVTTPDGSVWEVDVSPTGKILSVEAN